MRFGGWRIRVLGAFLLAFVATFGVQRSAIAGPVFQFGVLSADGTPTAGYGLNVIGLVEFSSLLDPLPLDSIALVESMTLAGTLFGSAISFDETDIAFSAHATDGVDLIWFTVMGPKVTDDGLFAFIPANPTAVFPLDDLSELEVWEFDTRTNGIGFGPRNAGRCVALTDVACPSEQLRALFVAVPVSEPSTALLALVGVATLVRRRRLAAWR